VQQESDTASSTAPATGIKAAFEEAKALGARPLSEFSAEREAERKRLGLDKNEGRDQERKNVMEELANAGDEAKRQRWMRAAKFFATWGSQPGPTLVAGMKALTESIPEFIADEKEQKKAKREAQKVLYTLEEATRQEKLGNFKEEAALKEKAGALATDYYKIFVQSEISAASDKSRSDSSRLTAELNYKGEQLRAKTAAASAANSRLDANERKLNDQYIAVGKSEERVLSELAKERSSKEYLDLQRLANLPESGSETIKKQRQDALDRLDKIDKEHATRAKTAADRTKFYEQKVMGDEAPGTTGMSAVDRRAAEQWLAANPKDPRAASIRQQLGR
jgi:hypothetical protein